MLVTLNPVIENDVPLDPTIQRLTGRHFLQQKQPTGEVVILPSDMRNLVVFAMLETFVQQKVGK